MATYKVKKSGIWAKVIYVLNRIKLLIAFILDGVDFILGNIPILNTLWDFVTFFILFIILKDKRLAMFSNIELFLPGLPLFGQIDAFIPIATILTIIDIGEARMPQKENVIEMERIN